ncbi:MAG TPA: hypothetical protein VM582_01130 [Candidatus Thermoplasmatota archaeon]|nr:hypothetical protein [Candidatus Thermoplasmatota archaeon]
MAVTLEELRDLSRRSRRAQRAAFLALLALLLLYPAQVLLAQWLPPTLVAVGALALGAVPFLRYAYLAGEERGAFRKVFRRLADERRTRTLVPEDAQAREPAIAAER